MKARILAVLAAALFLAQSIGGCGSAEPVDEVEPVEETATQQEAVSARPVNELGQPLNPITLRR